MNEGWIKDNYSIGEISEIFGIPKKMLRYWDSIDLLKPYTIDEINNYRYYSSSQFYLLNFIKYLRNLGVAYSEIKMKMNETHINSLEQLIKEQILESEKRIREIHRNKKILASHLADIEMVKETSELEVDTIMIHHREEEQFICLEHTVDSRENFEIAMRRMEQILCGHPMLLVSQVSLIMSRENFFDGEYIRFKSINVPCGLYKTRKKQNIISFPEGLYASVKFWGNVANSAPVYEQMREYLQKKNYSIIGDIRRTPISVGTKEGSHDHLAELIIPIENNLEKSF